MKCQHGIIKETGSNSALSDVLSVIYEQKECAESNLKNLYICPQKYHTDDKDYYEIKVMVLTDILVECGLPENR
jgi:hypothetical protein